MKTAIFYSTILAVIIFIAASCSAQSKNVLSVDDFEKTFKATENAVLIDARTPEEYADGYIKGALNADYKGGDLVKVMEKWDKTKTYFVYCRSGKRSAGAIKEMRAAGFTSIYDLNGGFLAWEKAGKPITKE